MSDVRFRRPCGSLDATTPQLGISLTVHPENPARHMYASCGFRPLEVRSSYHLMVAERPAG